MESQFGHFASLNAEHQADAEALLMQLRAKMTDQAYAELISAGVVKATEDKEAAARTVAGLLTVARVATKIFGVF